MFHEFWERNMIFISLFSRYFACVILVVVVFFLLHFSFFLLAGPNFELNIICSNDVISIQNVDSYQTTWIESIHTLSDQSCPMIQNVPHHRFRAFRILSEPFGARSIHEILSCSLKRSRETISELGKFHHGFASPGMVNFMGEKWENIDERKGEKLGKRWWKTWETLNIWKKNWKTWGKIWGKHQMFFPWFSLFCANTVSCCRAPREQTGMAHFQYSIYPIDLNSQRSWCGAPGRIWQTLHESTWQLPEKLQADPSWCSTMDHKVRKRRGNEKTWADLFDEFYCVLHDCWWACESSDVLHPWLKTANPFFVVPVFFCFCFKDLCWIELKLDGRNELFFRRYSPESSLGCVILSNVWHTPAFL